METKGFFQFEIVIYGLVISSRLIWIPVLWVHGHYRYFNSFSAGTVFIRKTLTYKYSPRTEKVNGHFSTQNRNSTCRYLSVSLSSPAQNRDEET